MPMPRTARVLAAAACGLAAFLVAAPTRGAAAWAGGILAAAGLAILLEAIHPRPRTAHVAVALGGAASLAGGLLVLAHEGGASWPWLRAAHHAGLWGGAAAALAASLLAAFVAPLAPRSHAVRLMGRGRRVWRPDPGNLVVRRPK